MFNVPRGGEGEESAPLLREILDPPMLGNNLRPEKTTQKEIVM